MVDNLSELSNSQGLFALKSFRLNNLPFYQWRYGDSSNIPEKSLHLIPY
ncbi:11615_t:CDS:2 [Entrophospora sp. SA101]|nr:11615_t:CDS:2 [Entrophospora sp. SA101]